MKVLDPQSALLTTAEVHQFLQDSQPRKADKKVGSYESVNVLNYNVVRRDLETYIQTCTPHVTRQSSSAERMKELIRRLKKYELTKTEIFALVNLGVGLNGAAPAVAGEGELEEDQDDINGDGTDGAAGEGERGDDEESGENSLNRMLFGLVVEEADERFAGDEGEERITRILQVLRGTSTGATTGGTGESVTE